MKNPSRFCSMQNSQFWGVAGVKLYFSLFLDQPEMGKAQTASNCRLKIQRLGRLIIKSCISGDPLVTPMNYVSAHQKNKFHLNDPHLSQHIIRVQSFLQILDLVFTEGKLMKQSFISLFTINLAGCLNKPQKNVRTILHTYLKSFPYGNLI